MEEVIFAWIKANPWTALGLYLLSAFLVALGTDVIQKTGKPSHDDPAPIQVGLLWPGYLFLGVGMVVLGACAAPFIGAGAALYWIVDRLGGLIVKRLHLRRNRRVTHRHP